MGHVLQMVVHLVLHIEDDALGDPGVDITLQDADDLGAGQGDEGQDQELDEQRKIFADQGFVHDLAGDDAGQQAKHSREQNCRKNKNELKPVGLQVGQDSFQQCTADLRHIFLFLIRQETAGPHAPSGSGHRIASLR